MSPAADRDYALRYARFVLRNRKLVMLLIFGSSLLAALFLDQINLRNDPDSLLPLSNRYIATNLYTERVYGSGNLMVWGMRLKQGDIFQPWFVRMLDQLYADLSKLPFANSANFIGIPSPRMRSLGIDADGGLELSRLLPASGLSEDPQRQQAQLEHLRTGLQRHLVMEALLTYYEDDQGNKCDLLGADGRISNASIARVHEACVARGTFIIGDFDQGMKQNHLSWIRAVDELLQGYQERYADRVEFLLSGEPYFLASMVRELIDKAWLFGISLLIVLLILYYEFRDWRCATLPLLGVGLTIVLTLGLMGFSQFKLTTMMVLTPVLLLAIGIGHAMQITRRFMQELHQRGVAEAAAEQAIRHTIVPAALSIGTDLHGFFALSFVDISFYKAYAYFGIFGMSSLILTTTTLIPLLLVANPPDLCKRQDGRGWETALARLLTRMLSGPLKWLPVIMVGGILWLAAHYAELGRGLQAVFAGQAGRQDPEVARIQDEFDIMPGAEKGIHYPRAAYKDHYLLGALTGDSRVRPIADLEALSQMMPGVITANLAVRSRAGVLPACGPDAWNEFGERVRGPQQCYDEQEDPAQGIFNDVIVLKALSEFEDWLRAHPNIGFTTSHVQLLKTLNMLLNAPPGEQPTRHMNLYVVPDRAHMQANRYAYADPNDPEYLPDPERLIPFYNAMLLNATGTEELASFINSQTWDEGIIIGFVNTMDPVETHRTIRDIQNYIEQHRHDPGMRKLRIGIEAGETLTLRVDGQERQVLVEENIPGRAAIGGFLGVTEATRDVAFEQWLHAPLATSTTVFLMTAIMFRSVLVAGLLVGLCFITLMTQYGLGGYMTDIKEWSANLAFHVQVALSIAMGLGIDYAVYMVSRLREEMRANGCNWRNALETTLSSTGSAILLSVAVLLGSLIPLMNTELANLWSVSLYIGEALLMDVLIALMFLPVLIHWLKPRYVFQPFAPHHSRPNGSP